MNMVVAIKQVPDVPNIRIDRERMTVIREGVESIINPLDYVALEAALDLRNRHGGKVVALTMGPLQSEEALREALAAGADEGILLTDPAFAGADTLATSHVLARAISRTTPFPDLILCGMQTIDSDTGHVGPQIAEELDVPQVCGVSEIHVDEECLVVKRVSDGSLDSVRVTMPVVLTVTQHICEVRNLPLGALEAAFSEKSIVQWSMDQLGLEESEVGLSGSATQVWRLRPPPPRREGRVFDASPQELVDHLIRKLEGLSVLDEEEEDQ